MILIHVKKLKKFKVLQNTKIKYKKQKAFAN